MFDNSLNNGLVLIIYPQHTHLPLLKAIAHWATKGQIQVLDGGNIFNAYAIARYIRRETANLNQALANIHVARAFTCYQIHTRIQKTPAEPFPFVLLNLLTTFYDESVDTQECQRLLNNCLTLLRHLSQERPVLISARPPHSLQSERGEFLKVLKAAADTCYTPLAKNRFPPARLF